MEYFMNTIAEPAFVADSTSGEVVVKNIAFAQFLPARNGTELLSMSDFCPCRGSEQPLLQRALDALSGDTMAELNHVLLSLHNGVTISRSMLVGYYNQSKTQIYFILKNHHATRLEQENEMFHAVQSMTNNILFRLSLDTMSVEFFGSALSKYPALSCQTNVAQSLVECGIIYEEDLPAFETLIAHLHKGEESRTRLRLHSKDGRNDWHSIKYIITKDKSGKPLSALGEIANIQLDKDLQDRANLDLLTSCLNKGTFESLAMNTLNESINAQDHAFFIIDLDNFKAVNDNLGHFFGDIVLKEVATKLKRIFRASDYIARIGGDEFAVLMKNIKDYDSVCRKAAEVVEAVDISYRGDNTSYRISASVGIAFYPQQADNYEDIYKRADIALYYAKNTGKNSYKIYDDSLIQGTMANTTPFDVANRAFSHFFDQEVAMDTFNLLFEANNTHDSVDLVLRHLGERFHVDRCYIFEASDDACTFYRNSYEWCAEGVEPQIDFLQRVHHDDFAELFSQANAEGVFYCDDVSKLEESGTKDILAPQGIISMLHTYVKREGLYKYVLGFDDCTSKRLWKPTEISTLMYASKIISQFLLYSEAIERAAISSQERLEVMENLNFFAYIVDNDTHQLHYCNEKTKALIPAAERGSVCYQVIRGKTEECDDCPLRTLRENNATKTRCIIHNEVLDYYLLVTASSLSSFGGKPCTFVSSTDISDIVTSSDLKAKDTKKFTIIE